MRQLRAFFQNIGQRFGELRALLNQHVAAFAVRVVDGAGHGEHFAPHVCRQPRGNQRAGFQSGFHHQHGRGEGGNQAVAAREVTGQRARAQWKLREHAALFGNAVRQRFVGYGIYAVDARAPHRHRAALPAQCTFVGGAIDAGGHAGYGYDTSSGQRFAEFAGNPHCLRRGVPTAHDGHRRPVQPFGVAAGKQ